MKKRIWKGLPAFVCALLLLFTACGAEAGSQQAPQSATAAENWTPTGVTTLEDGCYELDILSNIDMSTVTVDGNCVYFDVYLSPEQSVRFGGMDVTVENGKVTLNPNGMLFSLDYMGEMRYLNIRTDSPDCWVYFGHAYANAPSVDVLTKLHTAFPSTVYLESRPIELFESTGGFFALRLDSSDNTPVELTTLTLTYDPNVPQTLYSEIDSDSILEILAMYGVEWDVFISGVYTTSDDLQSMADEKMAEAGSMECDLISAIDLDSVTTDGDTTNFSAVMADGESIRFTATNVSIDETGMTLGPGATVTSLDAVGKIYLYTLSVDDTERYSMDNTIEFEYGYTYSASKTSVNSRDEIHTYGLAGSIIPELIYDNQTSTAAFQPNFISFRAPEGNTQDILVTSLLIGYNPEEKVTGVTDAQLYIDFTSAYLEGDLYNLALEEAASTDGGTLEFYLILKPDTEYANMETNVRSIYFVPGRFYTIGDLRNEAGEVLDKETSRIYSGYTLDLTVGDYSLTLPLTVLPRFEGAMTLKELLPYANLNSMGENHTLVVPVAWADQLDNASEETLDTLRTIIGKIADKDGNITDYSDPSDTEFSLSEYFETASYGKFTMTSFLTDWYYAEENFADIANTPPDLNYGEKILRWVKETYPDLDWTQYDQDGDGYVDSLVIINAGIPSDDEEITTLSYSGALQYQYTYYGNLAGTQDDPTVNNFVSVNLNYLRDGDTSAVIHEFSHLFGIIDYYDVTYSGINAVGGMDMQADGTSDWNAYSKLAVGWMEPQVVTGLASGESVDLTIGASSLTDDVIVIPAAGTEYDGPFGEYIMIDLFSDAGVNVYDTQRYGLTGVTGVRISHVDANMEQRTMEETVGAYTDETTMYTIGTVHYANAYNSAGMYNLEVIQAGGENAFTDLENEYRDITKDDLFYAGDQFTMDKYSAFFQNGLMDNGDEFGYTIKIISIDTDGDGTPTATIRITRD